MATTPLSVSSASTAENSTPEAAAPIAMRRRSKRSARAPPIGPATRKGAIPANVTMPTAPDEPVRSKTSQPRASMSVQRAAAASTVL